MDTKRLILAAALTVAILWLYQAWLEYQYPSYYKQQTATPQQDGKKTAPESSQPLKETKVRANKKQTQSNGSAPNAVPDAKSGGHSPSDRPKVAPPKTDSTPGLQLASDQIHLVFDKDTGNPILAELNRYKVEKNPKSPPVKVLSPRGNRLVIAQAGWVSKAGPNVPHSASFEAKGKPFEVNDGRGKRVIFVHKANDLIFRKAYTLRKGSYLVEVDYSVENNGSHPWRGHVYGQMRFRSGKAGSFFLYSFDGPVVFANDQMQTFSLANLTAPSNSGFQASDAFGWAGVMNRYFLSAWIPNSRTENRIFARGEKNAAFSGFVAPFPKVNPGEEVHRRHRIFLGPKNQTLLGEIGSKHELRRSVDYGILSFLAIPLFKVMEFFHSLVGNYGVAIILVTLVIKIIFFPLFSMSYRAMAKMRKVQPELQRIREQHGEDRQKMNEEMMRLYKEEKVNPLGGCLPILVQIPVFISLYWVLLESVELRHEPFVLWVQDLTSQDPFYILPVLMGASMVVQQMMNPAPMDPTQKKIMMALPVVFTIFFTQFPAGLVLYWLSNNLISIGQQWWIMRKTA